MKRRQTETKTMQPERWRMNIVFVTVFTHCRVDAGISRPNPLRSDWWSEFVVKPSGRQGRECRLDLSAQDVSRVWTAFGIVLWTLGRLCQHLCAAATLFMFTVIGGRRSSSSFPVLEKLARRNRTKREKTRNGVRRNMLTHEYFLLLRSVWLNSTFLEQCNFLSRD